MMPCGRVVDMNISDNKLSSDSVASVYTASMCTLKTSLWPVLLKTQLALRGLPVLATSKLKGVEAYDKSYILPCGLASPA